MQMKDFFLFYLISQYSFSSTIMVARNNSKNLNNTKKKKRFELLKAKVDQCHRYFFRMSLVGFGVTFCNLKTHAQLLASE
jgi:hypothetical protein